MNWLLKQLFYFRYLILKQGSSTDSKVFILPYIIPTKVKFYSKSFQDGQWNHSLPWEWNTRNIFSQQYGKFYFKAKLDGLVEANSRPAIWLYEEGPEHSNYYEIDIELFRKHLGYTVHVNHNGGQEGATVRRSLFANHKLYRKLQKEYHLFLIDWNEKRIKMYIDGILASRFRNEIHTPMSIIMGRCSMERVICEK